MPARKVAFPVLLLGMVVPAAAGAETSNYSYLNKPDTEIYFGHITFCERRGDDADPRVIREGEKGEAPALMNTPLMPGDTLVTGRDRRCEAQFDTGTVVRLDGSTRLRIETILAPALTRSAGVTNFLLAAGRIDVRYRHYAKSEVFQVLTPTAAVKLRDRAAVTIGLEADGSTGVAPHSGSAEVLFDRAEGKTRRLTVTAGQRLQFGRGHAAGEPAPAESAALLDFRVWNEARDRESASPAELSEAFGPLALPGAPAVVLDFAKRTELWGSWISTDVYGAVWRPDDNARLGWRPYLEGHWSPIRGDLFWVADEPWGWVPYHLGYWTHLQAQGWVWVPGSRFAPAWVRWAPGLDEVTWRPFDVWDFFPYDPWGGSLGYDDGSEIPAPPVRPPGHAVPRRPTAPSPPPSTGGLAPETPRPREIRRIEERMTRVADATRSKLKDDADFVRRSVVDVPWAKLSPQAKTEARPADSTPDRALATSHEPQKSDPASATAGVFFSPLPTASTFDDSSRVLLRDWNPDAPMVRAVGGRIRYSSVDNAVRCVSCGALLPWLGATTLHGGTGAAVSGGTTNASGSGSQATASPAAATPPSHPLGGQDGSRSASGGARRDN